MEIMDDLKVSEMNEKIIAAYPNIIEYMVSPKNLIDRQFEKSQQFYKTLIVLYICLYVFPILYGFYFHEDVPRGFRIPVFISTALMIAILTIMELIQIVNDGIIDYFK